MICTRFLRIGVIGGVTWALLGCGSTNSPGTSFGKPPGSTGASITRLDFTVDGNLAATQTSDSTIKTNPIRSFILVTVQGSTNTAVDFRFTNINTVPDPKDPSKQKQLPATAKTGSLQIMNPATGDPISVPSYPRASIDTQPLYIFYNFAAPNPADPFYNLFQSENVPAAIQSYFKGQFDPNTYTYLPPAQIVADPRSAANNPVPLDTFALYATPQDPLLAPNALLIHLNLTVSISPVTATISTNTPSAPALNQQQFTASVPGDGVRPSGTRQVTWSVARQDGSVLTPIANTIDPATGLFTAPQQAGTYVVTATSLTQPDKSTQATIVVQQATTTIGFKATKRP